VSTPAQRRVTLDDVERKARDEHAKGALDPFEWAFRHARAVARLAEAEQAWKAFDVDRYRLQLNLSGKPVNDEYDALVMVTASLHAAAADLGEARAIEVACAHVMRIAERQAGRVSQPAPVPKPKAA